jgi:hypothetical protein
MFCYSSEPLVTENRILLGCFDAESTFMASWENGEYQNLITPVDGGSFSHPLSSQGKVSWHEFDLSGVRNLYELNENKVKVTPLKNLGYADSFVPMSSQSWVYRAQESGPELWSWVDGKPSPLFTNSVSHIFPPYVDDQGGVVLKTREKNNSESSPDKLWYGKSHFKMILEDKDSNPNSPYKTFRHQVAASFGQVAVIATDEKGEVLLLIDDQKTIEVARAGIDLKSFDFFAPKLRANTLVFRGEDLEGRKALWVYKNEKLSRLVTQGDIVHTDIGFGRIDYKSKDAIFYGAPGVGPHGEIVQQATLSDADYPSTLLGIGLIRFIDR